MTHVLDSDTYDRHDEPELHAIARAGGRSVVDEPAPARGVYDGQDRDDERAEVADWGADDVFGGGHGRPSGREARRSAARGSATQATGRFVHRKDRPVDDWLAPVRDARPVTRGRARPAENWLAGTDEHELARDRDASGYDADDGGSTQYANGRGEHGRDVNGGGYADDTAHAARQRRHPADERAVLATGRRPAADPPLPRDPEERAAVVADRRAAALDELWSAGAVNDATAPQPVIRIRPPSILRAPAAAPVPRRPSASVAPAERPLTREYRDVGGRRTVVVRGQPATETVSPATEIVQRSARALGRSTGAARPERLAAWAVGLGFLLILVAIATASA